MSATNVQDKLGVNKFDIDNEVHILIDKDICSRCEHRRCLYAFLPPAIPWKTSISRTRMKDVLNAAVAALGVIKVLFSGFCHGPDLACAFNMVERGKMHECHSLYQANHGS